MENFEIMSTEHCPFVIANPSSNRYYAYTCENNNFIGFVTDFNDDEDTMCVKTLHADDFVGDDFVVLKSAFTSYFPCAEDIERWIGSGKLSEELSFAVKQAFEKMCLKKSEEVCFIKFPIATPDEHENIIREMISKVDVKKFKAFASMSCNRDWDEGFKRIFISKEATDKYLRTWATNKMPIYLAFGRNLKLETDYEADRTTDDFITEFLNLARKYERYAPSINWIVDHVNHNSLAANTIAFDYVGKQQLPTLSSKRKLTTLCHAMFEDNKFDADLGYIFQDCKLHRKLAISIDPIDYITMSENKSGWESCHNIHGGCYGSGGFAYMTDSATAIAYMHNGLTDYQYTIGGITSKWNSKEWRQCVYISSNSGSAIFSRQYPRRNDYVAKAIRELYENTICSDATWKIRHNTFPCVYDEGSSMLYHDCNEGYDFDSIRVDTNDKSVIAVGGPVYCIECGEEIDRMENDSRIICSDCYYDARRNESDTSDALESTSDAYAFAV